MYFAIFSHMKWASSYSEKSRVSEFLLKFLKQYLQSLEEFAAYRLDFIVVELQDSEKHV